MESTASKVADESSQKYASNIGVGVKRYPTSELGSPANLGAKRPCSDSYEQSSQSNACSPNMGVMRSISVELGNDRAPKRFSQSAEALLFNNGTGSSKRPRISTERVPTLDPTLLTCGLYDDDSIHPTEAVMKLVDSDAGTSPCCNTMDDQDEEASLYNTNLGHGLGASSTTPDSTKLSVTHKESLVADDQNESDGSKSNLQTTVAVIEPSQYDTCFGVVTATATSSFKGRDGMKEVPVDVTLFEHRLKLSFQDTGKYAGIMKNEAISRLLSELCATFAAKLIAPVVAKKPFSKSRNFKTTFPQDCAVRLVVYGFMADQNAIGDILGAAGLYLQHPSSTEYDGLIPYHNPHYLLSPGSQMPAVDMLARDMSDAVIEKSILDESTKWRLMTLFDETGDEGMQRMAASLKPSPRLRSTLQQHQATALAWLAEIEAGSVVRKGFPSLWQPYSNPASPNTYRSTVTGVLETTPRPVCGGVLADEMGLGKTLSILALICGFLDLVDGEAKQKGKQAFRQSSSTLIVAPKSDCDTKGPLHTEKWHRVVLDEAHHIRSRSSQIFKAACALEARHRWCLTGTPIHNSLDDFAALLAFIRASNFADKSAFEYWITGPIKKGRPDGFERLGRLIKATCLRRTKKLTLLSSPLPERHEKTIWVELPPEDRDIYRFFQRKAANIASGLYRYEPGNLNVNGRKDNIIPLINFLRLICDHGQKLLPDSALEAWRSKSSASIDWEMMQTSNVVCGVCGADSEPLTATNFNCIYQHVICPACHVKTGEGELQSELVCPRCTILGPNNQPDLMSGTVATSAHASPKVTALIEAIQKEQKDSSYDVSISPIKSVVFSAWTKMLDLTQQSLEESGFICQRIDGRTNLEGRNRAIIQFNQDVKCTVMLASIASAGEGDPGSISQRQTMYTYWNLTGAPWLKLKQSIVCTG
ncbi:hypothetical protein S40293_01496 [Stachybotrys chartarum IBT 40293]|nr:hypothetical protein S40293_01496 [Stachybotrys chartarum IBT 40293]